MRSQLVGIQGTNLIFSFFSYVLFSIGNLKPLFEAAFAECWDDKTICNAQWINAVDYLEICGIIVGQILVGVLGDWYVELDQLSSERF